MASGDPQSDDPLRAALELHAPERSEPKPDDSPVTTWLKLSGNLILDLRNLLVAGGLLVLFCTTFPFLHDRSLPAFWAAIVLSAVCLIIATWETVRIVRRRNRDNLLKAWAVTPLPSFHDDYFRIGPYDTADEERYSRPDGVDKAIIAWARAAQTPLIYLSGMSGAGKSSLINAALIPALERGDAENGHWGCVVIRVREFGDPGAQIRDALLKPGKIWKDHDKKREPLDLATLLAAACQRLAKDQKRLFLLMDQFEVILIRHEADSEETAELQQLFGAILESNRNKAAAPRFPNLAVLLSFRSDYEHLLKTFCLPSQVEDDNSKKVSPFSRGAAHGFLTDPASGLHLGEERVRAVLDEAEAVDGTRGLIRPIVLNMLGKLLQRLAGKDPGDVPRGALLSDDIRRAVDDPRVRNYSRRVLKNLLHNGIRVPRTVAEIATATGLAAQLVEGSHRVFREWPLVRCVEHHDDLPRSRWEIAHDFIARLLVPILETPRRTFAERLRSLATPLLLLCFVAVIAVSAMTNPKRERADAYWRLSQEYGFIFDGEIASALGSSRITQQALPEIVRLLVRSGVPQDISLTHCGSLRDVKALSGLRGLRYLTLDDDSALQTLDGLGDLDSLQGLYLSRCLLLPNVDAIGGLKELREVILDSCLTLGNVNGLKGSNALQSLTLDDCAALQNVDGLAGLKSLEVLRLNNCSSLKNVETVVSSLPNLHELYLLGTPVNNRAAILALKDKLKVLRTDFYYKDEDGEGQITLYNMSRGFSR